jgi:hypothetical protein
LFEIKFIFLDDVRGLVLVTSSDGINEAARDQASRQQLLRVFVKFLAEGGTTMKYLPPKHVGVICDGSFFCSSLYELNINLNRL